MDGVVALERVLQFETSASVSRIGFQRGRQNTPLKLETRRMCNTTTKPKNVYTFNNKTIFQGFDLLQWISVLVHLGCCYVQCQTLLLVRAR